MNINNKLRLCILSPVLILFLSCSENNAKSSKANQEVVHTTPENQKKESIQIDQIELHKNLDEILKTYNLTKDNNSNLTYNINLDYEEFSFDKKEKFNYKSLKIGEIESFVIYYTKSTNLAFCYELEMLNSPLCKELFSEYNTSLGKKTYDKKTESTKNHPVFLDENGDLSTDHITEELAKIEDSNHHTIYYLIYKENLTRKENKLSVIAITDNSDKFDEWIKFRSLDMVFE